MRAGTRRIFDASARDVGEWEGKLWSEDGRHDFSQ